MALGPMIGAQLLARFGFPSVFVVVGSLMLINAVWLATSVRMAAEEGATPAGRLANEQREGR